MNPGPLNYKTVTIATHHPFHVIIRVYGIFLAKDNLCYNSWHCRVSRYTGYATGTVSFQKREKKITTREMTSQFLCRIWLRTNRIIISHSTYSSSCGTLNLYAHRQRFFFLLSFIKLKKKRSERSSRWRSRILLTLAPTMSCMHDWIMFYCIACTVTPGHVLAVWENKRRLSFVFIQQHITRANVLILEETITSFKMQSEAFTGHTFHNCVA